MIKRLQSFLDLAPDLIDNQLIEIKSNLYPWEELPHKFEQRKIKTNWVQY